LEKRLIEEKRQEQEEQEQEQHAGAGIIGHLSFDSYQLSFRKLRPARRISQLLVTLIQLEGELI